MTRTIEHETIQISISRSDIERLIEITKSQIGIWQDAGLKGDDDSGLDGMSVGDANAWCQGLVIDLEDILNEED